MAGDRGARALAVVLAICSEADAFVATGLSRFSMTSRLVFLAVGPAIDVKLIALQAGRRFASVFAPLTFVVAVGGIALRLGVTSAALVYVKPGQRPLLVIAGLSLIVIGGAATRDTLHPRLASQAAHQAPGVAWLFMLVVFTVLLVAPPRLGAFAAGRQSGRQVVEDQTQFAPLVPAPVDGAVELSLFDEERSLEGKRVRLVGFVTPSSGLGDTSSPDLPSAAAPPTGRPHRWRSTVTVLGLRIHGWRSRGYGGRARARRRQNRRAWMSRVSAKSGSRTSLTSAQGRPRSPLADLLVPSAMGLPSRIS